MKPLELVPGLCYLISWKDPNYPCHGVCIFVGKILDNLYFTDDQYSRLWTFNKESIVLQRHTDHLDDLDHVPNMRKIRDLMENIYNDYTYL